MNIGSLPAPLWPSLLQPAVLGSAMLRGVPLGIYKGSVADNNARCLPDVQER